ncbi:MAG: family 10 glycosylhydrolase [Bacteroidia bacterium]|nr:family 10 glycosylhydrolase [Bacteroidia bacterium]
MRLHTSRSFRLIIGLLICLPLTFGLSCDDPAPALPKHEFRAVWVATFHNIDWPSAKKMTSQHQQKEFGKLLDKQQRMGMNAMVVQVRPSGDAFYKSRYAPWSEYISGTQGLPPKPYYDPLEFMINSCHDRNMEFHAWLNPFRAVSHTRFSSVAPQNIVNKHPEWTFQYGSRLYLNPGLPKVRDYLVRVVMEVVKNYDVDGIHFDDYFYPYPKNGEQLPDKQTFEKYGQEFADINSWRRNNIDLFIKALSDSIKVVKPHVKFGVSPVGIWRNRNQDHRGTPVRSNFSSYDMLHADVRTWLEKGWIDYVAPQVYFNIEHPTADYAVLVPWWAKNSFGRHVYVGQALFKSKQGESRPWRDPNQLPQQLKLNLRYPQIKGSIFFSANSFDTNPMNIEQVLRHERYRFPALIPPMTWKDSIPPFAPQNLKVKGMANGNAFLYWKAPLPAMDGDTASYYVVYRFSQSSKINLQDPSRIIQISKAQTFVDLNRNPKKDYTYVVTAVDRMHNESKTLAAQYLPAEKKEGHSSGRSDQ